MDNEDPKVLQKVQDIVFRSKGDLADIYRYYCALGITRPEDSYDMSNHQFCQFCKDCDIPTKFFTLPTIDQVYKESLALAHAASLSLMQFMTIIIKMAHLRYPELPDLFIRVNTILRERIMPHAKATLKDTFRSILYQAPAQAMLLKWRNKIEILFKHYAAADQDSTADAWLKTNTMNLREYLLCLTELSFVKQDVDLKREEMNKARGKSLGHDKSSARVAKHSKEVEKLLKAQGVRAVYKPEFSTKEAFFTFTNANLESDWETVPNFTLDTEMVMMEFMEGLARLAFLRLGKANKDPSEFPGFLDQLLSDCTQRFPHWAKYHVELNLLATRPPRLEKPIG